MDIDFIYSLKANDLLGGWTVLLLFILPGSDVSPSYNVFSIF